LQIKLEHIGIVAKDFDKSLKIYQDLLGLEIAGIEEVELEGDLYKVAFLPVGEPEVELVYTTADTGIAGDFLREKGEGIHHLAFEVDDIESYYKRLSERGVKFVYDGIKDGSRGTRVFFFAPEEFNGIYIEIVQKKKATNQ